MLPRLVLGHNALIGVNHRDRTLESVKATLTERDRTLLLAARDMGVRGMVLDDHPVALEAARFLAEHAPGFQVYPMVPHAQAVVDAASRDGLPAVVREMAKTGMALGPLRAAGVLGHLLIGDLPGAGARVALPHFLRDFPNRRPDVCFLHNAVTDLLLAAGARDALAGFAAACRSRGSTPGFVTLNPGRIPDLAGIVGKDCWFMGAVNSKGIQMSPSREAAERALADPGLNVIAMSVLGGGLLDPRVEIPRAFQFPAVKSLIIGTSRPENLARAKALVDATGTAIPPPLLLGRNE